MGVAGSTVPRRVLGRQLQALRKKAGISQLSAAKVLGVSAQTVGRFEDGLSGHTSDLYMNALCDRYGVSDEIRRTILSLAQDVRATKKKGGGWWRAHLDRPRDGIDPYSWLHDSVTCLTAWSVILLPRLIQTPDYLRAVAWTESPHAPTDEIEARIEAQLEQQQRLHDPGSPPRSCCRRRRCVKNGVGPR